jgi:hypothetical protein
MSNSGRGLLLHTVTDLSTLFVRKSRLSVPNLGQEDLGMTTDCAQRPMSFP